MTFRASFAPGRAHGTTPRQQRALDSWTRKCRSVTPSGFGPRFSVICKENSLCSSTARPPNGARDPSTSDLPEGRGHRMSTKSAHDQTITRAKGAQYRYASFEIVHARANFALVARRIFFGARHFESGSSRSRKADARKVLGVSKRWLALRLFLSGVRKTALPFTVISPLLPLPPSPARSRRSPWGAASRSRESRPP